MPAQDNSALRETKRKPGGYFDAGWKSTSKPFTRAKIFDDWRSITEEALLIKEARQYVHCTGEFHLYRSWIWPDICRLSTDAFDICEFGLTMLTLNTALVWQAFVWNLQALINITRDRQTWFSLTDTGRLL
jgi:hypothetical protein